MQYGLVHTVKPPHMGGFLDTCVFPLRLPLFLLVLNGTQKENHRYEFAFVSLSYWVAGEILLLICSMAGLWNALPVRDQAYQRSEPLRPLARFLAFLVVGMGQILNHQGTAGFSPCFHLPGFRFGYLFSTHSLVAMSTESAGYVQAECGSRVHRSGRLSLAAGGGVNPTEEAAPVICGLAW